MFLSILRACRGLCGKTGSCSSSKHSNRWFFEYLLSHWYYLTYNCSFPFLSTSNFQIVLIYVFAVLVRLPWILFRTQTWPSKLIEKPMVDFFMYQLFVILFVCQIEMDCHYAKLPGDLWRFCLWQCAKWKWVSRRICFSFVIFIYNFCLGYIFKYFYNNLVLYRFDNRILLLWYNNLNQHRNSDWNKFRHKLCIISWT